MIENKDIIKVNDLTRQLKHRIEVWRNIEVENELLEIEMQKEKMCKLWAEVLPKSSKVVQQINTRYAQVTHRVRIRYRDDITEDMWVMFKGRKLVIETIINQREENVTLELYCKEDKA